RAHRAVTCREQARLFEELRERQAELARSVDELTATADVLRAISSSTGDLEPVLGTLVETAARLCEGTKAFIFRRDGELYYLVGSFGFSDEYKRFVLAHPIAPGRNTLVGRTALLRETVHIPDALADPEYTCTESLRITANRPIL